MSTSRDPGQDPVLDPVWHPRTGSWRVPNQGPAGCQTRVPPDPQTGPPRTPNLATNTPFASSKKSRVPPPGRKCDALLRVWRGARQTDPQHPSGHPPGPPKVEHLLRVREGTPNQTLQPPTPDPGPDRVRTQGLGSDPLRPGSGPGPDPGSGGQTPSDPGPDRVRTRQTRVRTGSGPGPGGRLGCQTESKKVRSRLTPSGPQNGPQKVAFGTPKKVCFKTPQIFGERTSNLRSGQKHPVTLGSKPHECHSAGVLDTFF